MGRVDDILNSILLDDVNFSMFIGWGWGRIINTVYWYIGYGKHLYRPKQGGVCVGGDALTSFDGIHLL